MQERLGGDAAPVQTGTTELSFVDQGDPEPELGGTQGAGVAAAAGAEDDDVVAGLLRFAHVLLLIRCTPGTPSPVPTILSPARRPAQGLAGATG